MWSLTPRSFFNAVNGNRKKRDYESRERFMIGRRIMYAVVQSNSTQDVKEHELWPFPWESNIIQKLTEQEEQEMLEGQKASEDYFAKWDAKKAAKAAQQ